MTYIAKAMNKSLRLDAAADREAGRENAANPNVVPVNPGAEASVEWVLPGTGEAGGRPPADPRVAARAVTGIGRRPQSEATVTDFESLGTLETLPSDEAEGPRPQAKRVWWREPIVLGGIGLGLGALFLGFLFAPGSTDTPTPGAGETAQQKTSAAQAMAPSGEASGPAGITLEAPAASAASGGGAGPVVVRVQIDGGSGGRVELESAPAAAAPAPPLVPVDKFPEMPAYFEPLQPLELPPPPMMELGDEAPSPSRYAAEPVEIPGDSIDDFKLEGIFWSEDNPGAIINDTIVEPGKRVGALRVIAIHRNYVTVEFEGRTYDLR